MKPGFASALLRPGPATLAAPVGDRLVRGEASMDMVGLRAQKQLGKPMIRRTTSVQENR